MSDPTPVAKVLRASLSPVDLWDLMWRPEGVSRWLGADARIRLRLHERCALGDEAGVWRTARITAVRVGAQLTLAVDPAPGWAGAAETCVTFTLTDRGGTACDLAVEESGLAPAHREASARYWSGRLSRLAALIRQVRDRRASPRQAVIVIHGIGEQQPGETLGTLAASGVLASSTTERRWVKPDHLSGSYELRRITLEGTATCPTTDAFEFYWAHVIRDTSLGQIASWLRRLLFRWPVPRPLRPVWGLVWTVLLAGAGAMAASLAGWLTVPAWLTGGTLAVAAGLAWRLAGNALAVDVLGDAARYLTPDPANVAHRQAIRQAGVELLERLHESGHYDRVVVFGHSLGSVIAYDIVTHAWAARHMWHRRPTRPAFGEMMAVERALAGPAPADAQALQAAAWRQHRVNTQPWLVTDLVTAGSPLTYGNFLMAAGDDLFQRAQADRILPKCPPVPEVEPGSGHQRVTFDRPYSDVHTGQSRTLTVLHHAAPFAVTRWTNLYFEVGWFGLKGDLIGGPVAPLFGDWVNDVPLPAPSFTLAHTSYWRPLGGNDAHLAALRQALRLEARPDLKATLEAMPAFALFPERDQADEA